MSLQSLTALQRFPTVLDVKHHRKEFEAYIEHLITMLDTLDAPVEDLEPETDEEGGDAEPTDDEDRWVPVSLNVERLPPRQVRSPRSAKTRSSLPTT